jgi:adenine phosphoribosyltransferase
VTVTQTLRERVLAGIRDVPDHPTPGVLFKDISPLLADGPLFGELIEWLAARYEGRVDVVTGIEARGFVLAAPLAVRLGVGFVPVRKAGKLPWDIEREEYELEYGSDLLEIHRDAVHPGERVLIVDDVLATGGTASAVVRLIEGLGAEVVGLGFAIELEDLAGRDSLKGYEVESLITY